MRRSLLSSVLNVIERNARLRDSLAMFEIGSVYIPNPANCRRTAPPGIAITGRRYESAWDSKQRSARFL
jgi:phenylalanyl-tRNA synthetase beta subunit